MLKNVCTLLALASLLVIHGVGMAEPMERNDNEKIVHDFIAAWSSLDSELLADYFDDDGVYHNMPSQAVRGKANIQRFIAGFTAQWESTDWQIITSLAQGDTVVVERLDITVVDGQEVRLPCFGIFELKKGKIVSWRDYFDLSTYIDALGKSAAQA
mgnify:CR=1 FL=1